MGLVYRCYCIVHGVLEVSMSSLSKPPQVHDGTLGLSTTTSESAPTLISTLAVLARATSTASRQSYLRPLVQSYLRQIRPI